MHSYRATAGLSCSSGMRWTSGNAHSLLTMLPVFLSQKMGTVYLPAHIQGGNKKPVKGECNYAPAHVHHYSWARFRRHHLRLDVLTGLIQFQGPQLTEADLQQGTTNV